MRSPVTEYIPGACGPRVVTHVVGVDLPLWQGEESANCVGAVEPKAHARMD